MGKKILGDLKKTHINYGIYYNGILLAEFLGGLYGDGSFLFALITTGFSNFGSSAGNGKC